MEESALYRRMRDQGVGPLTKEDWQEMARVIGSLAGSMHHVYHELDVVEEALDNIEEVLKQAGFQVDLNKSENEEHLKALMEALEQ